MVEPSLKDSAAPPLGQLAQADGAASPVEAAPDRAQTVSANAVWMMIGNVSCAAGRWLLLVIFAKFATEAMVGQYGWALAFCMPVIVLCRPAARVLISTDLENRAPFNTYLALSLTGAGLGIAIVGLMALVQGYDSYLVALILGIALWNSCESVSDAFAGLFLRRGRADLLAAAFIGQAVLMIVLAMVGLRLTGDLRVAVLGLSVASLARILCWEIPVTRRMRTMALNAANDGAPAEPDAISVWPSFQWPAIWRLMILGAPIAVVGFLTVACMSAPRYIVKEQLGDAQAGIFFALYQVAFAQYILINALGQSLWSHLADLFGQKRHAEFGRRIAHAGMVAAVIGIPGILVAAIAGRPLLSIMFRPAYAAYNAEFVVLMLAGFLEGLVYVLISAITSMRRFRVQVPIYVIKLALTYFGGLWAVGRYGLAGVSWAMVIAAATALAVLVAVSGIGLSRASSDDPPFIADEVHRRTRWPSP